MTILLHIVAGIFLFIVLFRTGRFLTTPLLRRIGFYKYYAPLFLTMPAFPHFRTREIHLGTSFDFVKNGALHPHETMWHMAEGLVHLGEAVRRGEIPRDMIFEGTTHYLTEQTLDRFGFTVHQLTVFQRMLFVLNIPELVMLQSIARRRPTLIHMRQARRITIEAETLLRHMEEYEKWRTIFAQRTKASRQPVRRSAGRGVHALPAGSDLRMNAMK